MPFLSLPKDPSVLRFKDGEVTFHYLLSTPTCQTFVHASAHAETFESAPTGSTASRHKKRLSAGSLDSRSRSRAGSLIQPGSSPKTLELDPGFPVLFFLPSEMFSCTHLFGEQLADEDLAKRFNLVAVDPRGHGLTKDVPISLDVGRNYDLDIKAADIATFIQRLCNRALGNEDSEAVPAWTKGIHLLGCSMSGLVAARVASKWPDAFASVVITSPILELESEFMIESFQDVKELIEETWEHVHRTEGGATIREEVKMPGEVVQGCTYRWAGEESIPHHISSYLTKTWLERLILHKDGNLAAKDWWFDLYWLRQPMLEEARRAVKCDMLVVEGDLFPLYERTIGGDFKELFPNCKSFKHQVIEGAPFLLSITRPHDLRAALRHFLSKFSEVPASSMIGLSTPASSDDSLTVDEVVASMTPDERFELIKVYAPACLPTSDDEADSDGGEYDKEDDEIAFRARPIVCTTSSPQSLSMAIDAGVTSDKDDASFASISTITTVETFLAPGEADRKKQEQVGQHVEDLVHSLEIGV